MMLIFVINILKYTYWVHLPNTRYTMFQVTLVAVYVYLDTVAKCARQ